jgi:hypothetical protein
MANIFHASSIVSQAFGPSALDVEPPLNGYPHWHRGIDLVGPYPGCPVYAAQPGHVQFTGADPTGNYVIVLQDDQTWAAYWHLATWTCTRGDRVDNTTQIGTMGNTGGASSTGYHTHFEVEAPGPWRGLLSMTPIDPVPYLTDNPGTTPTDMNPLRIAKDLYEVLDPSYSPPDNVLQDKANAIASTDTIIPVLHDLLDAKPWRSPDDYNMAALEAYATAKGFPDPKQYAFDRVSGGDTFDTVITGDLSADKAHADQLTQLNQAATAQLNAFSQAIHALQNQVATLNDENQNLHIALEKTEQPADQTPEPQPDPVIDPAPAHDPQPDQTPVEDPTSQPEPARMSYLAGLYYLLSKLFLGR